MLGLTDPPWDQFWSCVKYNLEYKKPLLFTESKTKEDTALSPHPCLNTSQKESKDEIYIERKYNIEDKDK